MRLRRLLPPLAALVSLAVVSYAFLEKPHVRYAGTYAPFHLLSAVLSLLLIQSQWWALRVFRRENPSPFPHWVGLLIFNLFMVEHMTEGWDASTDMMVSIMAASHFLDGLSPFPNFWYFPALDDLAKNGSLWNYLWSPFSVWLPLPFLALYRSPYQALQLMTYLTLLAAYAGWSSVARRFGLKRWALLFFGVFLTMYMTYQSMHLTYVADIFSFMAFPWCFWFAMTVTDDFRRDPLTVRERSIAAMGAAFGGLYLVKYSAIFSGIGGFLVLAWWILSPVLSPTKAKVRKLGVAAAAFGGVVFSVVLLNQLLTGVGNVVETWRAENVSFFSRDSLRALSYALAYPGDLIRLTSQLSPVGLHRNAWFYLTAAAFYLVMVSDRRSSRVPLIVIAVALLIVPALALWYTTVVTARDSMFIGRYRFTVVPFAAMLLLVPQLEKPYRWRTAAAPVLGVLLFAWFIALPGIRLYSSRLPARAIDRREKPQNHWAERILDPWPAYTPFASATIRRLNRDRSDNRLLVLCSGDSSFFHLYALARGKTMLVDNGDGWLFVPPYYTRAGVDRATHRWFSSRDMEIYILRMGPEFPTVLTKKFPQVEKWEVEHRDQDLLLLKGKLNASLKPQ